MACRCNRFIIDLVPYNEKLVVTSDHEMQKKIDKNRAAIGLGPSEEKHHNTVIGEIIIAGRNLQKAKKNRNKKKRKTASAKKIVQEYYCCNTRDYKYHQKDKMEEVEEAKDIEERIKLTNGHKMIYFTNEIWEKYEQTALKVKIKNEVLDWIQSGDID